MTLINQIAPDFTLKSHQDQEITLSSYQSHKHVVLVFYPLDFSPVCSTQVPEYAGQQDEFIDLDTVILGINRDSLYTHRAWAAEYGIDVPLLADMNLEVARRYGVAIDEQGITGRAVFLIDKAGKVRLEHIETTLGEYTIRPDMVLAKIKELKA